jgi:hypothetical protein
MEEDKIISDDNESNIKSDDNEMIKSDDNDSIIKSDDIENEKVKNDLRKKAKEKAKAKQLLISENSKFSLNEGQKRYELKKWNSVGLWQWGFLYFN